MEKIVEVKRTLTGRIDRFECDVADWSPNRVVVLYRVPEGRNVHGVWLPAGTVTVGYFWRRRPYNLYHWIGPDGATLAYYFNVGDVVRLSRDVLEWHDLAVDVLATPGGRVTVLDEDELPDDLEAARRHRIEAARDTIVGRLAALQRAADHESAAILERVASHHHSPATKPAASR